MAGTNIAKVTGRNAKGNLLIGAFGDLEPAGNVVNHLGHQPCPVNGIDRANAIGGLKISISRYRLDHILAIIEYAIEGDVEDIRVIQSKHLCLLEGRHPAGWGEHKDANAVAPAHRILCRGPCIA